MLLLPSLLIMAFPDAHWLKILPIAFRSFFRHSSSPITAQVTSMYITPQGLPLPSRCDNQASRSRNRPPSTAQVSPLPGRSSKPRCRSSSTARASPSPDRSSRPRCRPPSTWQRTMAMAKPKSSSSGLRSAGSRYQIPAAPAPNSFDLRNAAIHLNGKPDDFMKEVG